MTANRTTTPGSAPAASGRGGVFYGWWVLAAAAALGFCAFGVVIPGFLAFSVPVRAELGLSAAQTAFIVGAAWGVGDIATLLAGWLADRYGARRLILAGGLLCGAGFAAMGLAGSFRGIVLAYSVAAAAGRGLGVFPTLMTAVNQWFQRRKAFAITVVSTAVTAGAAALLPAMSYAAAQWDWRSAAFVCGGAVALLTLPAAAIIRSRPEDLGLLPYGASPTPPAVAATPSAPAPRRGASATAVTPSISTMPDYSVGQAVVTLTFVALAAGAILRTVTSDVLVINQIPILIWKGVAAERAGLYLSLTYFATIPARFVMGLAAAWIAPRWLLGGSMAAVAVCSGGALLLRGEAAAGLLIAASALGQGVSSASWIALGSYFGRRSFGTLVGMITVAYGVSGLIFPSLAGAAFDRTGNFTLVLLVVAALQGVSAGAFMLVRRPASRPSSSS